MTALIASEWLKTWSLRSTWWVLALTAAALIGSATITEDVAFPLAGCLVLMVVAASFGAATMVGEYSSGLIRATTAAVPSRSSVILAKAVVVTAIWTALGALVTAGSLLVARGAVEAGAATAAAVILIGPVCAVIGLGIAVLLRHAGAVYVTAVVLLAAVPPLLSTDQGLSRAIHHAMPVAAWQRLTQSYGDPEVVGDLYTTPTRAWLVYILWPLVILAAALLTHRRRDV